MNLIKATIATAAITVCCLGNDYPAQSSQKAYINEYNFGFLYGSVANACMNYYFGFITKPQLMMQLEATEMQESATLAIKGRILKTFQKLDQTKKGSYQCLPMVRSVFQRSLNSFDQYNNSDYTY